MDDKQKEHKEAPLSETEEVLTGAETQGGEQPETPPPPPVDPPTEPGGGDLEGGK